MTAPQRPELRLPAKHGYGLVLVLIITTYVLALAADRRWMVTVVLFVQTATVWQALRTSRARTGLRLIASLAFALAIVAAVSNLFVSSRLLTQVIFFVASGLYLVAPVSIVRDIGLRRRVDSQTMFGALAAYLLIGMAFGFGYECIALLQSGPLFGEGGDPPLSQALFFSFVTLTTTGYGNQVPVNNPAQSVAVLEALIGQLFLITAVAKVVENWRPVAWRRAREDGTESDDQEQG
jgi:hypothetical protein